MIQNLCLSPHLYILYFNSIDPPISLTTPAMSTETKPSETYEAGCHCGNITFSVTLSPPLTEYKVLRCNCSICRRAGYLLTCAANLHCARARTAL